VEGGLALPAARHGHRRHLGIGRTDTERTKGNKVGVDGWLTLCGNNDTAFVTQRLCDDGLFERLGVSEQVGSGIRRAQEPCGQRVF